MVRNKKPKDWPYKTVEEERFGKEPIYTTKALVASGMKRCDECGALNPLEKQICAECNGTIVMFVTP